MVAEMSNSSARKGEDITRSQAFSRRPPYLAELLFKPYPVNYEPPTFILYDSCRGSVIEHVSKFLDAMGPYAGNEELCPQEFSKSLTSHAYTWCTTPKPRSIQFQDDMVESFVVNISTVKNGLPLLTYPTLSKRLERSCWNASRGTMTCHWTIMVSMINRSYQNHA